MKTDKISESGTITDNGQLRLPMDRLNAFFAANKGKRVVVRFEAAEPGSTELQLAYYFNYIVPTIQTALWENGDRRTEKQVDLWLRQQCASCYNDYGGLLEARQISKPDFSDFIEWLKQFAAENLYVYIEDPKTI
jgi:hypothetical protein